MLAVLVVRLPRIAKLGPPKEYTRGYNFDARLTGDQHCVEKRLDLWSVNIPRPAHGHLFEGPVTPPGRKLSHFTLPIRALMLKVSSTQYMRIHLIGNVRGLLSLISLYVDLVIFYMLSKKIPTPSYNLPVIIKYYWGKVRVCCAVNSTRHCSAI